MIRQIFIILLITSGCCNSNYDPVYVPPPAIKLKLDCHYNGFTAEDTFFSITTFSFGKSSGSDNYYYSKKQNDSSRTIEFYNIYNTEKIFIESMTSNYMDSFTNMGYNYRNIQNGNNRCNNISTTHFFNIHSNYRSRTYSSGESSLLQIDVKK
jgi:hypothetical protein